MEQEIERQWLPQNFRSFKEIYWKTYLASLSGAYKWTRQSWVGVCDNQNCFRTWHASISYFASQIDKVVLNKQYCAQQATWSIFLCYMVISCSKVCILTQLPRFSPFCAKFQVKMLSTETSSLAVKQTLILTFNLISAQTTKGILFRLPTE